MDPVHRLRSPPIVWKKNSVGVIPLKKLFDTNPFATGLFALIPNSKCGNALPKKPSGDLLPPTVCCPTHETI